MSRRRPVRQSRADRPVPTAAGGDAGHRRPPRPDAPARRSRPAADRRGVGDHARVPLPVRALPRRRAAPSPARPARRVRGPRPGRPPRAVRGVDPRADRRRPAAAARPRGDRLSGALARPAGGPDPGGDAARHRAAPGGAAARGRRPGGAVGGRRERRQPRRAAGAAGVVRAHAAHPRQGAQARLPAAGQHHRHAAQRRRDRRDGAPGRRLGRCRLERLLPGAHRAGASLRPPHPPRPRARLAATGADVGRDPVPHQGDRRAAVPAGAGAVGPRRRGPRRAGQRRQRLHVPLARRGGLPERLPAPLGGQRAPRLAGRPVPRLPLFRSLRDPARLRGRCGDCAYATVCGGSRARAYALSGDPLGEDPTCIHRPEDTC